MPAAAKVSGMIETQTRRPVRYDDRVVVRMQRSVKLDLKRKAGRVPLATYLRIELEDLARNVESVR